jgi:hypothetical protein
VLVSLSFAVGKKVEESVKQEETMGIKLGATFKL